MRRREGEREGGREGERMRGRGSKKEREEKGHYCLAGQVHNGYYAFPQPVHTANSTRQLLYIGPIVSSKTTLLLSLAHITSLLGNRVTCEPPSHLPVKVLLLYYEGNNSTCVHTG